MKTYRFCGLQITFRIDRVKRMTFDIPDWANDCWTYSGDRPHCVRYWRGETAYYIDLPKCKGAKVVSVDRLYNKDRTGYNSNRKIVIDVYL